MTYSGFVYIWFDKYKTMFYIGSHRGCISDSYVCSSRRMLKSYRKRPGDFKRRILKYVRAVDDILLWEQYYLNMVKDSELLYNKGKYYNIKRTAAGGDTIMNLPNRNNIIKRRYGKKHSDAIKLAIKKRSKEREIIHQQRRKISLRKTYTDTKYCNYQDRPFIVYLNNVFYKQYRNKAQFILEHCCDRSNFIQNFNKGRWIIKHKRKHKFVPGDILTFKYV